MPVRTNGDAAASSVIVKHESIVQQTESRSRVRAPNARFRFVPCAVSIACNVSSSSGASVVSRAAAALR